MTRLKLNISHIVPPPSNRSLMHGLYGYKEVVETIRWGLIDIGCDVTVTDNSLLSNRVNLILGAQALPEADLRRLPANTIIYNFEQVGGQNETDLKPEFRFVAEHFRVWEYSERNLASWKDIGPATRVVHVPVGWAPILNRIERCDPQDIDILVYASPAQLRLQIFQELCDCGMKCMFVCGLYGKARDDLIGRAKLILNINRYDRSRIFEIVRVSYLLANAKAVVADIQEKTFIEPGIEHAVAFAKPEDIRQTCVSLLDNDQARAELEIRGREIIENRHISIILKTALEQSGLG
jgi:hypothetical protein